MIPRRRSSYRYAMNIRPTIEHRICRSSSDYNRNDIRRRCHDGRWLAAVMREGANAEMPIIFEYQLSGAHPLFGGCRHCYLH